MPDLLEFEEPVGVLLKEIEALSMMPRTPERERSIETLRRRADEIRAELYQTLTPWQRVLVARHPNRPNTLDYVQRLFTKWDELKVQVAAALERAERTAADRLRDQQATDRLNAGATQAVPEAYRRLVEKYYRALAR